MYIRQLHTTVLIALLALGGCGESMKDAKDTDTTRTNPDSGRETDTVPVSTDSDSVSDDGTASSDEVDTFAQAEFENRAQALVSAMTLPEKVSQMGHSAAAIPRLGIGSYNWWNEALHGVARSGLATVFPQAISLAATFDPDLMLEIATVISTEARVMNNTVNKGLTYWSPTINLARDPRWGRNEETYGEDPYLASRMAKSFVRGMQGNDPKYLKTVSTAKHFIANNIEATRHTGSSNPDERNLREFYMPAFRTAVMEGRAYSVMCAYNALGGVPSCANDWLLQDVLRDEWGFDGYIVSDCGAIQDIVSGHRYVETNIDASKVALAAGTDLNCGDRYQADLVAAVEQGLVDEAAIDQAVFRLMLARMKLGEFDPPEAVPYTSIPAEALDSAEHKALALKAAEKSMVLLKNDGMLPLDRNALSSIAVIGPNAARIVFGGYSGTASNPVSALDGIARAISEYPIELKYVEGSDLLQPSANSTPEDAVALAAEADAVILVLGTDLNAADEGRDRTDIALPSVQEDLLEKVVTANANTVVVLVTGMPLAVNWADEHARAILDAGYGGQSAGDAIAGVLFGAVNPGGRLPQTYFRSVADLPPMDDYDIIGGKRTYMFFDGEVLYPFGHGLSYTEFSYSELRVSSPVAMDGKVEVSCTVKNDGDVAGDEVVQLYVRDTAASVPVADRQLKRFSRVPLAPGASQTLSFTIPVSELAYFDMAQEKFVVEPGDFEVLIGASSADIRLKGTVFVEE